MKVTCVCFGPLRTHLPVGTAGNRADIELPAGASVATLATSLGIADASLRALLVDGVQAGADSALHDGAEVVLMPPFSGGARSTAILTVSDSVVSGDRVDESGDVAARLLTAAGFESPQRVLSPDDAGEIEKQLRRLVEEHVALVVSTGGTGFAPRDVTPEATKRVIERDAPGIAELMRSAGLVHTPNAALSRAVCGIADTTIIVNLPGSPRGVQESLESIIPLLEHALALVVDESHHGHGR